jgi:hypothetical protein
VELLFGEGSEFGFVELRFGELSWTRRDAKSIIFVSESLYFSMNFIVH